MTATPSLAFSRKVEPPLLIPHASGGLIELQLAELLNGPAKELLTRELRAELSQGFALQLDELFGEAGAYVATILQSAIVKNDVESVAADMHASFSYKSDAPVGTRHQISFGARSMRMRMTRDRDWTAELSNVADSLPKFRGIAYLPIPVLSTQKWKDLLKESDPEKESDDALLGKIATRSELTLCAVYPDPRTLVLVFGKEELQNVLPERPAVFPERLSRLHDSVGGGVLTMVLPAASLKRQKLEDSDERGDKAVNDLLQHVEVVALGVDIAADNRLGVRLRCGYRNAEEARAAEQQAVALVRLGQDALSKVGTIIKVENNVQKPVDGGVTFYREFLQNHKLLIEVQRDGTADLVFESNGSGWFERQ